MSLCLGVSCAQAGHDAAPEALTQPVVTILVEPSHPHHHPEPPSQNVPLPHSVASVIIEPLIPVPHVDTNPEPHAHDENGNHFETIQPPTPVQTMIMHPDNQVE